MTRALLAFFLVALSGTTAANSLVKSTDGGRTWRSIDPGFAGYGAIDLQVPRGARILYALMARPAPELNRVSGAYRNEFTLITSADGGASWHEHEAMRVKGVVFAAMSVLPTDPHTIYIADSGTGFDWGGIRLLKSSDGGRTANGWTAAGFGYPLVPAMWSGIYFAADGATTGRLFLSSWCAECGDSAGAELFLSEDDGRVWRTVAGGMTAQVLTPPATAGAVYVVVNQSHVLLKSTDSGTSWNVKLSGVYAVSAHPDEPNVILASNTDGHVLITRDGGETWARQAQLFVSFRSIQVHPSNPSLVFAQPRDFPNLLLRSEDRGLSWDIIDTGLTGYAFSVDPEDPATIYGFADVYLSVYR